MLKKISNKELIEFSRVLSLLLYSKIALTQALDILSKQTKNANLKSITRNLLSNIRAGNSISKSFSKYPELFNDVFIANLKVAEETGQIAEVINEYTTYLEKIQALKRKAVQAVRYPIFVLIVAISVVFFMLYYIIPTFETLFLSFKAKLPPITKFLLSISNILVNHNLIILVALAGVILIINQLSKSKSFKENVFDNLIWRVPLISNIYMNNLLSRFSLSMGVLLKNKVGLLDALKISRNISNNKKFKNEIEIIIKRILKGESMSGNIYGSKFFDLTFSRLLTVGEESAELDKVFIMMSEYYNSEFDYYLDNITSMMEPVLILFVGGMVAFILVGLYLPMFDIINYFGV